MPEIIAGGVCVVVGILIGMLLGSGLGEASAYRKMFEAFKEGTSPADVDLKGDLLQ